MAHIALVTVLAALIAAPAVAGVVGGGALLIIGVPVLAIWTVIHHLDSNAA